MAQKALVESSEARGVLEFTRRLCQRMYSSQPADELASVAREHLVVAALKYDWHHDASFATFATKTIKFALMTHVKRERRRERRWRMAVATRTPLFAEAADATQARADTSQALKRVKRRLWDARLADGLNSLVASGPPRPDKAAFAEETLEQHDQLLARACANLPEDQATIIRLHFYENQSLADVAVQMNLSRATVYRRRDLALHSLQQELRAQDVSPISA